MAKKTLKAQCENVQLSRSTGQVRFSVGAAELKDPAAIAAAGPGARAADVVISVAFKDQNEASKYVPGYTYTITIE